MVYVAYVGYCYEGKSEPIGVFDNLYDAMWCAYGFKINADSAYVKNFKIGFPRREYE